MARSRQGLRIKATQGSPAMGTPSPHAPEPVTVSMAELDRDPHEVYRRWRPLTPLLKRPDGSYIVIRAADIERLIADQRTRQVETELPRARDVTSGPLFEFFANSMLFSNGPEHRRRRSPLSRTFAARLIVELRPRIRAVADRLLDNVYARGEMNLLDEYAALLPAHLISEILGVPDEDIPQFTGWVYRMARAITPSFTREEVPDAEAATDHLTRYVAKLLANRWASPQDDVLTSYVRSTEEEGKLSPAEVLSQIVTVILGGSDTTRAAMAIQVSLLLQHREQWADVCRDPVLIPGAVAESLRYEPSVGSIPRFTLDDIELEGQLLPGKRLVTLSTMSAMRDPAVHADPDRFDIRRDNPPRRHMVFGLGSHRCLGEALARAELEEGLAALTERLPQLRIAGDPPTVHGHGGIRRVSHMHVRWS
jgi:cytochrome P450 family 103